MWDEVAAWIAASTGARAVERVSRVQSLWGGYGELVRVGLDGAERATAIVKVVDPPRRRGGLSDERKRRSYEVETEFYRTYGARCSRGGSRVAELVANASIGGRACLLLEDLEPRGARGRARRSEVAAPCLAWLASFHATFLGEPPEGLWPEGTYWHLATRPDELAAIEDAALRAAAPRIDAELRAARFQTIVHGDAKPANFCFGADPLAAVDFQYAGGGVGVKDVAYLLAGDMASEQEEADHLDAYFRHLGRALRERRVDLDPDAVEREWRALYPLAAADFHRFIAGWAPHHYRADRWAHRVVGDALRSLDG